jgi:DNA topoisomerase I
LEKYTLIITEKPDAASRIATALDKYGKPEKVVQKGVPYYHAYRNGDLVVVPALGHLYTVASKNKARLGYPEFDFQWVPRYLVERGASRLRVWLEVIAKLAENADEFVDACDFDIEGSIIGYCILKYTCNGKEKEAKRMKYSTLTEEELRESFANMMPKLDFALVEAGLTRHEVDWLYGINLSRALTSAAKNASGQYATLSTGRVQGPTLKFLEEREKTINSFIPTPYWTIKSKIIIDGEGYEVEYERTLETKQEAKEVAASCKTKTGKIETVTVTEFMLKPPFPFDLGSLQSEAYKLFHYTPMRTSNIAQHLYLNALISYPRTSSQKLPPAIGYQTILKKLAKTPVYAKQASELLSKPALKPNEGTKTDSAHPAIYPTGNLPEKSSGIPEGNVFDLIVRRFLTVFAEPAIRQNIKGKIGINGNRFLLGAERTLSEGWIRFYKPYVHLKEAALPPLVEGQVVEVKRLATKENFTKPPARYNPRSLLLKMEKEEIGTKATRGNIFQTLCDRKYIIGADNLAVSDLGFSVIEILAKYCPIIVSPEFTRKLERKMDEILLGKQSKKAVLHDAVEILKPVMQELKDKQQVIGTQLSQALTQSRLEERKVAACPKCFNGKLIILRSKKTGKRFVGCTNYFLGKCNAAFPLPQSGSFKPSAACKICGYPTIYESFRGKRSWKLCLNPECPSKGASSR